MRRRAHTRSFNQLLSASTFAPTTGQKTVTNVTHFYTTFAENAREVVWKCVTFVTVF